jgi:phosphoribosyl 1,2-cyclic phosphate phosphodiesterase
MFSLTFLGTGTSTGIPMIACDCPVCLSTDPRDQRLRCSLLINDDHAQWLVDTGPDLRQQCLRANIRHLDAALITHAHTDHIMGFDELRRFTFGPDDSLPVHASHATMNDLRRVFDFAFNGHNRYAGYLKPDPREIEGPFRLGRTTITALPVLHGKVDTSGFLFHPDHGPRIAYIPDCKTLAPETLSALAGIDTLIIDALRFSPHPTHMNFEEALAIRDLVLPRRTFLTHFQCEVMHARAEPALPPHVRLAYDGLTLTWDD